MPWPATHILIAEKIFEQHFNHLNRKDFLIGTCFPDIRYPSNIERERTHLSNLSLVKVQSQSPFKAGLLFHGLVDRLWNSFVRKHKKQLFAEVPHNRPMFHTIKILQDGCLYDKGEDWQRTTSYFKTIHPEELDYGIRMSMVQRWHDMLTNYLSKPPNINDLSMLSISLPAEVVDQIRIYYQEFHGNLIINQLMGKFYDQIEDLMDDA